MADESSVAAGKRFAKDMKRVREDRGLSVDDIHEETRVARSIIRSFENGGLYDHSTFNEVYLRSFVRTYAEALNISADVALEGLDAALEGTYEDQLAREYLPSVGNDAAADSPSDEEGEGSTSSSASPESGSSSTNRAPPEGPVAGGPEGRGGLVGPPRALGEEGPSIEEDEPPSQPDQEEVGQEASPPTPSEQTPSREEDDSPSEPTSEPDEEDVSEEAVDPTDAGDEEAPEQPEKSVRSPTDEDRATAEESSGDDSSGTAPPTDEPSQEESAASSEAESSEEEESLDVRPSWMEESPDEEETLPSSADPAASGEDRPAGASSPPDLGDTGIVGEATAMGEEASPKQEGRSSPAVPPGRERRQRSVWRRFLRGDQNELLWAGIGIAVVLIVLVGLGVAFFTGEQGAPDDRGTSTASADTAARASSPDTVAADSPPPADVRLGESIPLTVIATANVSGIRIRRDDDLRRPYWIGEGEAQVFPFERQVTLQDELDDVRLLIAGYPYPFTPEDTTDGLEITRDQVQAFVDTLRGAPTTLSVRPDTVAVGAPEQ